ncbi:MAG: hypothetical protein IH949_08910, partial [Bacteroidetes bacterium]|nr:hypothetical protein [Bacteroidota bacterium]
FMLVYILLLPQEDRARILGDENPQFNFGDDVGVVGGNVLISEFPPVYNKIKQIGEVEIVKLQKEMDKLNSTWTPGRLPDLKLK